MDKLYLFFSACFFTNAIPHFVNGISGRQFVEPFFYRFVSWMPNSLFNVLWGILSFIIGIPIWKGYLKHHPGFTLEAGFNTEFLVFTAGVIFTAVFLSIFFMSGGWNK